MAKENKPAAKTAAKSSSAPKSAAKAKTAEAKSASSASKAAPTGPFVDPSRAAAAAAAMVVNKISPPTNPQPSQNESAMFRQMKDALNKPHAQTIGGLLDKFSSNQQKKSAAPFGAGKQVGHNQTVGSDASRRSVPRRTGG
jgi:hypothetical protein